MIKIKDLLQIITYLTVFTGYGSVALYMGRIESLLFAGLLILSFFIPRSRSVRIPRWVLNLTSIGVIAATWFRISPETLVEPILGALALLVGIKLLEEKKFRDYMQIFMLCMFLLIGSSFVSVSVVFLLYFTILLVLLTGALILLAYFSVDPEIAIHKKNLITILSHSVLICTIAVPASLFFFLILPRTHYPLLSFLYKKDFAQSGFSDRVTLGGVSTIQENNEVIFRAEMKPIDPDKLYWRGLVLDKFDGASWQSGDSYLEDRSFTMDVPSIKQSIYLEPYGNRYLFALDQPSSITLWGARELDTRTFVSRQPIIARRHYDAVSTPSDFLLEPAIDRNRYLQLPQGFSPKIEAFVKHLAGSKRGDELIRTLYQFLKHGEFKYSLINLPVSENPLEEFLFDAKRGNCEYFASSFAVMLRMAGVPARLVGGYRGGQYNGAGGYYLVLQKNAHVWVEAYTTRQGWLRLDPTPALPANGLENEGPTLFTTLGILLDTFNYYWYKFIIDYDLHSQIAILQTLGSSLRRPDVHFGLPKLNSAPPAALLLVIPLLLVLVALALRKRRSRDKILISKFAKRMSGYGYVRKESEGLEEFVARIEERELKEKAGEFVHRFEALYYRDRKLSADDFQNLERSLKDM